jgi:hypothetical protein
MVYFSFLFLIQLLIFFFFQPLVMYFNSGHFEQDINANSPTKGKLASCFGELVRDVFSTSSGSAFTPTRFKKEVKTSSDIHLIFETHH